MALITGGLFILWLTCLYLMVLGAAMLLVPDRALRFLSAFAQTPRANLAEAMLRLIVGFAFVIAAPALDHPFAVRWFGVFLAATALLLLVAPDLHRRFAGRAVATVAPFLRPLGVASMALGLMLAVYLA